ncbi:MAG TPA: phenylalanine--tRNA ligase subunit beta [archaeon]|nr:phenylalanine--tRNA ligase subunit beta [archaeon]
MPKIDVSHKDLCGLIGRKLSTEQLADEVLYAKGELDEVNGDTLKIDIKDTNRPDLWSAEGVAREIRARSKKSGLQVYEVRKSSYVVNVDTKSASQPMTVSVVAKNIHIDDAFMSQIIQLQEKLSVTFGRNRKDISMGIYDIDKITFPLTYTSLHPEKIRLVPLDFKREINGNEILELHPKGKEFGHLLKGHEQYPIWVDANKNILSMPPIINSDSHGKVVKSTKNVFIECTGYDMKILNTAICILAAQMADRGANLYSVKVNYGKKSILTPDMSPKKFYTTVSYVNKVIGTGLTDKKFIELAEKSLYDAKIVGRKVEILYPAYRQDIMHERDIVEDIAISLGFNSLEPLNPKLITKGGLLRDQIYADRIAEVMTGCGFQEILSYTLTNTSNLFEKMNIAGKAIEIEKPQSSNWSVFRTSLLPGLMEFLAKNKHVEYPQSVFEIGDTIVEDQSVQTRSKDVPKMTAVISAAVVNYDQISSTLDALLRNIGIEYTLKKSSHPSFIEGRTAEILVGKTHTGFIGEIHPAVLNGWDLENPVVAFEIDLEEIFNLLRKR